MPKVEVSTVYEQLYNAVEDRARVVVLEGSSRSSKTYSILQFLISYALKHSSEHLSITIARERLTWIKSSVMIDFLTIIDRQFHRYNPNNWNKSDLIYTLGRTKFNFIGLDEAQKLHGRKQDIFWINEAIEAKYKDFEQLIIRTTKFGILDYNPSAEVHWIYDRVLRREDAFYIHSTYKDNPFLEPVIVTEIEKLKPTEENIKSGTADETSWKIYGLGLRACQKGLIFTNVGIVKEFPALIDCKKTFYGMDFGFTNHPSALIKIALCHGELYAEELFYEAGLVNIINPLKPQQKSIERYLSQYNLKYDCNKIWADSAEPKSIQEISDKGYNIVGVVKSADSILNGIDIIKRYKLNITEKSINLIHESQNYKWFEDRTGTMTNKPVDAFNHGFDALRYGCMSELATLETTFDIRSESESDF